MKQILKSYIQRLLFIAVLILIVLECSYGQQSTFGKTHNLDPLVRIIPHATMSIKTKDASGKSNGYIVVGYAAPTAVSGGQRLISEYDIYLLKIDNNGNVEWQRTIGEPNTNDEANQYKVETPYGIDQTRDGGYMIVGNIAKGEGAGGYDFGNLFLIKTDQNGILQWYKTYERMGGALCDDNSGFSSDRLNRFTQGLSVKETYNLVQKMGESFQELGPANGYIITGYTGCQYPYPRGYNQAYLMKTDIYGTLEWTRVIDEQDNPNGASGQVTLQTNDGSIIMAGYISNGVINIYGTTNRNILLLKYSNSGTKVQEISFGGLNNSDQYVTSIQQTNDGGFIITGLTDRKNGILIKIEIDQSSGFFVKWAKEFSDPSVEGRTVILGSVIQTGDGGFIVGGSVKPYTTDATAFLFKVDQYGNKEWVNINGYNFARGNQTPNVFTNADGGYAMIGVYDWSSGTYIIKTDALGGLAGGGNCTATSLSLNYGDWKYISPRYSIIENSGINAPFDFSEATVNHAPVPNTSWGNATTIWCENIVAPSCQTNLDIIIDANTDFNPSPKEFHAGNSITTSGVVSIPSGNNVHFKAVNHVQLTTGFTASAVSPNSTNTVFKASLEPCIQPSLKTGNSYNSQSGNNKEHDSLINNIGVLGQTKIYPNPSSDKIYIESNEQIKMINLFSINSYLLGSIYVPDQSVLIGEGITDEDGYYIANSGDIKSNNTSTIEIDVNKLTSGVYIIEMINKDGAKSYQKFLKQ